MAGVKGPRKGSLANRLKAQVKRMLPSTKKGGAYIRPDNTDDHSSIFTQNPDGTLNNPIYQGPNDTVPSKPETGDEVIYSRPSDPFADDRYATVREPKTGDEVIYSRPSDPKEQRIIGNERLYMNIGELREQALQEEAERIGKEATTPSPKRTKPTPAPRKTRNPAGPRRQP